MTLAEYYKTVWNKSSTLGDEELETLLSRAADVVDNAIYLSGVTVETVPERLKTRVYKAVCAQADHIDLNGGAEYMSDSTGGSVSLGKYSYSAGTSESGGGSSCGLCKQARGYLISTGLLYRGVDVI